MNWYLQSSEDCDVVKSSRIRLARNLNGFKFNLENKSEIEQLENKIKDNLYSIGYGLKYLKLKDMDDITKMSLVEKNLISPEFALNKSETGSILINDEENICIMIGGKDHINIQVFNCGLDLENTLNLAIEIDKKIEDLLGYAINKKYGYLTSSLGDIGTGLKASVMVHLPALAKTKNIRKVLEAISSFGMNIRGMYGENNQVQGDIYQISNKQTLGITEQEIVQNVKVIVQKIIEQERQGHGSSPKSLIYDTYDEAWRCQEPSCKGVKYDVSKRWYCASRQAVEYMMDPRNSLDAAYIFQFQDLSSSVGDREAVKKMTENTFLYNDSYIDAIIEAAQTEGISPFHIVSRIKQEQGATGAGAMNGYLYRTKTGEFVKVYNLFNINVSGNDTEAGLLAGAQYAYDQQWFSVEASIKGGAKFIKKQYINQGQATLYFQKYNVVDSSNLFNHQYMQNIRAANDEGNTMYRAYLKNGILSSTFEFTIPVYENMPVLAVPRPQYIPVQKITTEQETYIIGVNEVIDINYGYLPRNASNTDFSWTASNSSVLSVYWNRVRGLKEGTSQIIVKTQDGSIEKQITIIVQPKVQEIIPEQEEYTIGVNEVIDINYSYLPTNAANIDFSWTVSDTSILSVYWNKVRGLKEGTAYVIVKTLDGSVEKRIKIVVQGNTEIQITPEKEIYTIGVNEVIDINCTYSPNNVTEQDFTWTASDSSVLSVYWNKVRGLKAGTSEIIIKSLDGTVEKRITVVVQKDTGIKITPEQEKNTIGVGEVIDIDCTYSPNNVPEQEST